MRRLLELYARALSPGAAVEIRAATPYKVIPTPGIGPSRLWGIFSIYPSKVWSKWITFKRELPPNLNVVKSGHTDKSARCPLCLRKRTLDGATVMSALGQEKRTSFRFAKCHRPKPLVAEAQDRVRISWAKGNRSDLVKFSTEPFEVFLPKL